MADETKARGYLYLHDNQRMLKVGKSYDLDGRRQAYATGNPLNEEVGVIWVGTPEDADRLEKKLLDETSKWGIVNGNSRKIEWRERCREVVDVYISFASKHGYFKGNEFAELKEGLEDFIKQMPETQLYTKKEALEAVIGEAKRGETEVLAEAMTARLVSKFNELNTEALTSNLTPEVIHVTKARWDRVRHMSNEHSALTDRCNYLEKELEAEKQSRASIAASLTPKTVKTAVAAATLTACTIFSPALFCESPREWRSDDGKFACLGHLERHDSSTVWITKSKTGSTVAVPLNRLSAKDRAYIATL